MQVIKKFFLLLICSVVLYSCSFLDRNAKIVSESGLQDSKELLKISRAKDDIVLTKQSLKLAIIKMNLMTKSELKDEAGLKKAVFIEARAFSPILFKDKDSPFHLFNGDPIFTKLVPEFYQLLDVLEYRKVPVVVDCSEVPDCSPLRMRLKKQYNLEVFSLSDVAKQKRSLSYIVMLSSYNISLKNNFSSSFRTAFKYKWLSVPLLYAEGLKIEEWANLIPKVKEL